MSIIFTQGNILFELWRDFQGILHYFVQHLKGFTTTRRRRRTDGGNYFPDLQEEDKLSAFNLFHPRPCDCHTKKKREKGSCFLVVVVASAAAASQKKITMKKYVCNAPLNYLYLSLANKTLINPFFFLFYCAVRRCSLVGWWWWCVWPRVLLCHAHFVVSSTTRKYVWIFFFVVVGCSHTKTSS